MLKDLFTRIKSEKSKASSIAMEKQKFEFDDDKQQQGQKQQPEKIIRFPSYQLPELNIVQSIPIIQYGVLQNFPDLTASILSCPITFHVLPYSNRRVKQISTAQHQKLPEYATYMLQIFASHLHNPNHFLINDYPPGVGIMPHFDGPAYYPKVLVYSIGTTTIKFVNKKGDQKRLFLEDKSLHIFEDEAYTDYMHGIQDYGVDCIFFKVEGGEVTNCSVDNFQQTKIYRELLKKGLDSLDQCVVGDYEIAPVSNNQEYTHELQIPRKRRISITIRHKSI